MGLVAPQAKHAPFRRHPVDDHRKTQEQLIEELRNLRLHVARLEARVEWADALLSAIPLGIHECDPEGRITFVNPAQEAITGYSAEELVGTYAWDRIVPGPEKDSLPTCLQRLVAEQPPPKPYLSKNIRKNGEVFDAHIDWNYKRDARGQVTGFATIVSDVTEHARAEAARQKIEERYRTLAESATDIIYIVDRDGTLLYANQSAATCIGLTPAALVGKRQHDLFPPEAAQLHMERLQRVFETGEIGENDELFHFGPQETWLSIRSIPLHDDQGRIVAVMGVCRDITERKRAEQRLRESEAELRQVAASISDYLWSADVDRTGNVTYRYYSPAVERLTGRPAEFYMSGPEAWISTIHPEDQSRLAQAAARLVSGLSTHELEEYRILRPDGTTCWLRGNTAAQRLDDGTLRLYGTVSDITVQKRAEEALQQAHDQLEEKVEERTAELHRANAELAIFRRFAEASNQGFGMSDLDGSITYLNPALCRMVKVARPEDAIGKHVPTYFSEGRSHRWETEIVPAILQEGHWEDVLVRSFDGKVRIILQHGFLIRGENGKPSRLACVMTDISELKRAEEALRESEQRFDLAVRGSGVGIFDWNILTGKVYYSSRWKELFGYEEHDIGDGVEDWSTLLHPDERDSIIKQQDDFFAGTSTQATAEYRLRHKDGSYRWIMAHVLVVRDEKGRACRLVGSHGDVTDRKHAEEALRQSRDELQAIYDQMIDGVIIVDAEKVRAIRVNPAFCRMLGYSAEELQTISPESLHPPEVFPEVLEHFEETKRGGVARLANLLFLCKDGSHVYADVVSTSVHYRDRPCWFSFFHDVTDRRQSLVALMRERRTLEHMLQASDHERKLIAYDVHDGLAQQLAGAIMQFQIYDYAKDVNPEQAAKAYHGGVALLKQGHAEARRIISGVRPPILDESGVVAAVAHLVHDPSVAHGPKVKFYSGTQFDRLPSILENAIYRIVQEGLTNACKHSKSPRVRVRLLQRGERLRIEIRDWGVGFDPKVVKKNHFGLTGVRERARLLGGKCRIRSTPGEGTSVVVELPLPLTESEE